MAKYSELYLTIAKIFRIFIPLFEETFHFGKAAGRTFQVITKAANYILEPGQSYEGTWHVEGLPQENIIGSGIFYYSTTSNVKGNSLAFRDKRDNDRLDRERTQNRRFYKNLGRVRTLPGRCLVFTNDLQHKVKKLSNPSNFLAVRKILCFFVVAPSVRIPSSLSVPEQYWDKIKIGVCMALWRVSMVLTGSPLPQEVTKRILSYAKWGFTRKEAEEIRLKLMHERKYYVDKNNGVWERSYSFCEH